MVELGHLKATSVHQEFRVLRRIFSVAVKKKLVPSNPCASVEFPVAVKGLFRPHYMTWSEQSEIERHAPAYLRNVIRIITETGLRVYKELICLKKEQVDIANKVVFVIDSKTPTGVSEVPLTDLAAQAFQDQLRTGRAGTLAFSKFAKAGPAPAEFQEGLAKNAAAGWRASLQNLRSAVHVCNQTQCWRGRRRVGDPDAPTD